MLFSFLPLPCKAANIWLDIQSMCERTECWKQKTMHEFKDKHKYTVMFKLLQECTDDVISITPFFLPWSTWRIIVATWMDKHVHIHMAYGIYTHTQQGRSHGCVLSCVHMRCGISLDISMCLCVILSLYIYIYIYIDIYIVHNTVCHMTVHWCPGLCFSYQGLKSLCNVMVGTASLHRCIWCQMVVMVMILAKTTWPN